MCLCAASSRSVATLGPQGAMGGGRWKALKPKRKLVFVEHSKLSSDLVFLIAASQASSNTTIRSVFYITAIFSMSVTIIYCYSLSRSSGLPNPA